MRPTPRAGRRAGFLRAPASRPRRHWARRCSGRCGRRGRCAAAGSPATRASGGIPGCRTPSPRGACGITPRCRTTPACGGTARRRRSPRGRDAGVSRRGSNCAPPPPRRRPWRKWPPRCPPAPGRGGAKEGSKGPITADFALVRAVAVRDGLPGPAVWLVLRRNTETGELQGDRTTAAAATPPAVLVRLSGMRWPIARCFAEGKQHLGLGDYEVRSWRGWHHHLTLVILAHFFLMRLQCRWGGKGSRAHPAPSPPAADGRAPQAHLRPRLGAGSAGVLATPERGGLSRASYAPPRAARRVS